MRALWLLAAFGTGWVWCWYGDNEKIKEADNRLAQAIEHEKKEDLEVQKEFELSAKVDQARDRINKALGLETEEERQQNREAADND